MVKWRRVPGSRLMTLVDELIKAARETRRGRYRICDTCGKTRPPEWMASDTICQSCAEKDLGVVH
jgi:hypothetical protein